MSVKLLTEHHLEFLSFKGGCTGSSESTLVKMPHCWIINHMINNFVVKNGVSEVLGILEHVVGID